MKLLGIAGALYSAYNCHDPAAVAKLYDADGAHEDIAMNHCNVGPAAIECGLLKFFGWFPDACWTPNAQIGEPAGPVTITYLLTATLRSQLGRTAARGQRISLRGVHVLHVERGLIHRSEDYWDAATFQKQLNST